MQKETFNLTTDPWIKVIRREGNQPETVSLIELFEHAQDYRQLAGDMRTQDFAILRLLLAILTTVYSRYDVDGERYDWIAADPTTQDELNVDAEDAEDRLLTTWDNLYQSGQFSTVVTTYLKQQADKFDLFGEHPFYQVTAADYDALVAKSKRVALGKGTVALKQLNRRVSESNNTPALFAPKADETKNQLSLDELARWLITYQNYAGTTDKTKVETTDKFSSSSGWLYKLNAVYVDSTRSLFEMLMLNLVLVSQEVPVAPQHPVWEYDDMPAYVAERENQDLPNNLAALYTTWARILHVEWSDQGEPTIFSAGVPMFSAENAHIEPMTTWKRDKKTEIDSPATRYNVTTAMWRNFGSYVGLSTVDDTKAAPGIVKWVDLLIDRDLIADNQPLALATVTFISGGAPANLPVAEYHDDMQLMADVLFDERWQTRIEDVVQKTQTIGRDFYGFAASVATLRGIESRPYAGQLSDQFYSQLNEPFKAWLASLQGAEQGRVERIQAWQRTLHRMALDAANAVMQTSSPRDVKGITGEHGVENIFTATSRYQWKIKKDLKEG